MLTLLHWLRIFFILKGAFYLKYKVAILVYYMASPSVRSEHASYIIHDEIALDGHYLTVYTLRTGFHESTLIKWDIMIETPVRFIYVFKSLEKKMRTDCSTLFTEEVLFTKWKELIQWKENRTVGDVVLKRMPIINIGWSHNIS